MGKTPRVDKRKNIWKVAEVIILNPNKTQREIAKETDMSLWAVNSSLKEVEQSWTKDETITYIVWAAKDRIKRASKIFDRYLWQVESKKVLDNRDISLTKDIIKDDVTRVMWLGWDITDSDWWLSEWVKIVWMN